MTSCQYLITVCNCNLEQCSSNRIELICICFHTTILFPNCFFCYNFLPVITVICFHIKLCCSCLWITCRCTVFKEMNCHFSNYLLCSILECNFRSVISGLRIFIITPRCWIWSAACVVCNCSFSIPNCIQRIGLLIFFNILCQLRRIIY